MNQKERKVRRGAALLTVVVAGLGLAAAAAAAEQNVPVRTPIKWVPGEQMPLEDLKNYPCHIESEPCSRIPPPPVEKVTWSGELGDAERGKKIALDLRWGNCIGCHSLPGGAEGGNIGPSLADLAARKPPLEYTFQRIWDTRVYNPNAFMPIYGPNRVLSEAEIRDVMAYLYQGAAK